MEGTRAAGLQTPAGADEAAISGTPRTPQGQGRRLTDKRSFAAQLARSGAAHRGLVRAMRQLLGLSQVNSPELVYAFQGPVSIVDRLTRQKGQGPQAVVLQERLRIQPKAAAIPTRLHGSGSIRWGGTRTRLAVCAICGWPMVSISSRGSPGIRHDKMEADPRDFATSGLRLYTHVRSLSPDSLPDRVGCNIAHLLNNLVALHKPNSLRDELPLLGLGCTSWR